MAAIQDVYLTYNKLLGQIKICLVPVTCLKTISRLGRDFFFILFYFLFFTGDE